MGGCRGSYRPPTHIGPARRVSLGQHTCVIILTILIIERCMIVGCNGLSMAAAAMMEVEQEKAAWRDHRAGRSNAPLADIASAPNRCERKAKYVVDSEHRLRLGTGYMLR